MNKAQDNKKYNSDEVPEEDYVSGQEYQEQLKTFTSSRPTKATWQQKLTVAFLIIFGLSAIVLWGLQLRNTLVIGEPLTPEELEKLTKQAETNVDILRETDTDNDGLSDYDELYFFNTSPYLEDTDSDGIIDKQELEQGQDPNCPAGQQCVDINNPADSSGDNQPANNYLSENPEFNEEGLEEYLNNTNTEENNYSDIDVERQVITDILSGKADAESLREMLLQAGMDPNTLSQISDDDLINVYRSSLQSN